MIDIKTYIKDSNKFVVFDEFNAIICDPDYIEGAIQLDIDGKTLISVEMWDYVDQLWSYIIHGLVKLSNGEEFNTYFPDQPIEMRFVPLYSDRIKIYIRCDNEVSAVVSRQELVLAVKQHADAFFKKLEQVVPSNKPVYDNLLGELRSILS